MKHQDAILGMRVTLVKDASKLHYLIGRKRYLNLQIGMEGTIIKDSGDKLGIEFDNVIWTGHNHIQSSFDNGCHGFGEAHKCCYIPSNYLEVIGTNNDKPIDVCLYAKQKQVILFRDEEDIKEFIKDKATESKGGDNTSHYIVHSDSIEYNKFLGKNCDYNSVLYLITFSAYSVFSEYLKDYPIYKWNSDSKWVRYRMTNMRLLNHNKPLNLDVQQMVKFNQPITNVIITGTKNKVANEYAKENDVYFIHGMIDESEISDKLSKLAKDGGRIMMTKHHAEKLDLDMLNCNISVYHVDLHGSEFTYFDKNKAGALEFSDKVRPIKSAHRIFIVNNKEDLLLAKTLNSYNDDLRTVVGSVSPRNRMMSIDNFNRYGGILVMEAKMFIMGGIRFSEFARVIHLNRLSASQKVAERVDEIASHMNHRQNKTIQEIQSIGRTKRDDGFKTFVNVAYGKISQDDVTTIEFPKVIKVVPRSISMDLITVMPMAMPDIAWLKLYYTDVYQVESEFKEMIENGLITF